METEQKLVKDFFIKDEAQPSSTEKHWHNWQVFVYFQYMGMYGTSTSCVKIHSNTMSCGVKTVSELPALQKYMELTGNDLQTSLLKLLNVANNYQRDKDLSNLCMKVPFVILSDQISASREFIRKELNKLAVNEAIKRKNPNSGNLIQVWVIDLADAWRKFKEEDVQQPNADTTQPEREVEAQVDDTDLGF